MQRDYLGEFIQRPPVVVARTVLLRLVQLLAISPGAIAGVVVLWVLATGCA